MYKAKSASIMRGAETRAKLSPKTRAVFGNARTPARPNLNAKITVGELIQFNSATISREAFLAQLQPAIQRARRAGYSTPLQITTFLNRNGWRTACDERWDERLTVLLLRLVSPKPNLPPSRKPLHQPSPRRLKGHLPVRRSHAE